ncbi:MFS transporter [Pelagovum sp. HNIBRBA483]|uniref:MFS transporter n=1 Tax=Pelagovum sp. HNIBRBA483 TaxID=3233341 RepID=UPI0034A552C3
MTTEARAVPLAAYSLMAGVISAAGLPIYIYAPKYFADNFGVSLTTLGSVLFFLRLFDVIQDPILGWISERIGKWRPLAFSLGGFLLAISMIGLFSSNPLLTPLLWFALTISGLFSAFSFLSINFYAFGIAASERLSGGHFRLAAWRESGALIGICIAAIAPALLVNFSAAPFQIFSWCFAALAVVAILAFRKEAGRRSNIKSDPTSIRTVILDRPSRSLLILALINAMPLAVSSTLFLFFVESKLMARGWEGPLLVLFFLAAAVSAPMWSAIAGRIGVRRALMAAMILAILSFGSAYFLSAGDLILFTLICLASGASIGADLTLLPALFAKRMSEISPNGSQGFGLWSFSSKLTLAIAAVTVLPILEASGFSTDAEQQTAFSLDILSMLYALVPISLKVIAIGVLVSIPREQIS